MSVSPMLLSVEADAWCLALADGREVRVSGPVLHGTTDERPWSLPLANDLTACRREPRRVELEDMTAGGGGAEGIALCGYLTSVGGAHVGCPALDWELLLVYDEPGVRMRLRITPADPLMQPPPPPATLTHVTLGTATLKPQMEMPNPK